MSASLHRLVRQRQGWTNAERAHFARIERLLADTGLAVDVEHGQTDEGDPWCVFCARASGDVVIHAACIDGRFMIDSPMLPRPIEGRSFERCAERFFEDCRLPMALSERRNAVMLHPSALLASLFITILLYAEAQSGQGLFGADAVDADGDPAAAERATAPALRLKTLAQQAADYAAGSETGQQHGQHAAGNAAMAAVPAGMALAAIAIAEDLARAQELEGEALPDPDGTDAPGPADAEAARTQAQRTDVDAEAAATAEEDHAARRAGEERAEAAAEADVTHGLIALLGAELARLLADGRSEAAVPDRPADAEAAAPLGAIGAVLGSGLAGIDAAMDDLAAALMPAAGAGEGDDALAADAASAVFGGAARGFEAGEAVVAFLADVVDRIVSAAGEGAAGSAEALASLAELFASPAAQEDDGRRAVEQADILPGGKSGVIVRRVEADGFDFAVREPAGPAAPETDGREPQPAEASDAGHGLSSDQFVFFVSQAREKADADGAAIETGPDRLFIVYGDLATEDGINGAIEPKNRVEFEVSAADGSLDIVIMMARWDEESFREGLESVDALLA